MSHLQFKDFRSDTITKPSLAMRKAMSEAEVGDDVYGDDPTVNRLEASGAKTLGKEAALFASSGTQTNLLALLTHCGRGDEYIVGQEARFPLEKADEAYRLMAGGCCGKVAVVFDEELRA